MTEQELKDLKHRCKYAIAHGFEMAKTDELAAELVEGGASKPKAKSPSPAELLTMILEVEDAAVAPKPKIVVNPNKQPSKKVEAPKSVAPKAKVDAEDDTKATLIPEASQVADVSDAKKPEDDR